jgi:uncharacterized membrane protein YjjB (DUF3815 family)
VQTILFAPRAGGAYTWSLWNIPKRLAEYALFPFFPHKLEIVESILTPPSMSALVLALVALAMLLAAVASSGKSKVLVLAAGWTACLGPVLILDMCSNVYGYTACAFACGFIAVAYAAMKPWAKVLLAFPALLAMVHGIQIGQRMVHIGSMQRHLYADVERLLPAASPAAPLRIRAMNSRDNFVVRRFFLEIPTYHRQPWSDRIQGLPYTAAPADPLPTHLMTGSGRLVRFAPETDARRPSSPE